MHTMQNISINKILYENLGSKITLTLINAYDGDPHAKIICQNVISYSYISIEDERDTCAMFICDLDIKKSNALEVLKKKFLNIVNDSFNDFFVLSACSGESEIEIICEKIEIVKM